MEPSQTSKRKLVSICKIEDILPIEGNSEKVVLLIKGWKVLALANKFNKGDLVVFCEIDSFIPEFLAPELCKGKNLTTFNGVSGSIVKTFNYKKVTMQGHVFPMSVLPEYGKREYQEGEEVTKVLGILKYEEEAPDPQDNGSETKKFPDFIPKTEQERVQNINYKLSELKGMKLEITEKCDGNSMTAYSKDGHYANCSRNCELHKGADKGYGTMAKHYKLEEKLRKLGKNYAIQGEVIGEGILGYRYKIKGKDFYVFNVYDIDAKRFLTPVERRKLTDELGLKHCPVVNESYEFTGEETVESLLAMAEGKSLLNESVGREGLVFKSLDGEFSFKVISNEYLKTKTH